MTDLPDEAVEAAARAWQAEAMQAQGKPFSPQRVIEVVLTAAAPHIAAQATRDVRAERDSILRRIDRLESDESWWVGGAWGDYGEAVIPLRALSTLTGPLADAGPEWETRPEFAAAYGDLRATVEKQTSEIADLRAGIEALRDEWQDAEDEVTDSVRYDLCKGHADALDALLREENRV